MKSISQQTRSLIQKQQELGQIDCRISQLKQQLKLQESNNNIIEFKVNKILETKKNAVNDQSDYSKSIENMNQEQEIRKSKIMLLKQQQEEDLLRKRIKQDEEKQHKKKAKKERQKQYQEHYRITLNQELQLKQEQFQKIQEQKFRMKQKLDMQRIEKIENVRNNQIKKKAELSAKFDLQQQEYQLKVEEEQQLLKKLSFSQFRFQTLQDDLELAQKISIRDYTNSTTNQTFIKQPFDQTKIKKIIMTSPYAQIPSNLNYKNEDKFNLLQRLLKPSFKDQQLTTERLNKKNNQLSDRIHKKQNSTKFETETSKTRLNKLQPITKQHTNQQQQSDSKSDIQDKQKIEQNNNQENKQKDVYEQDNQNDDYSYQEDNQEVLEQDKNQQNEQEYQDDNYEEQ